MKTLIGKQGEVKIYLIDALPEDMQSRPVEKIAGGTIISHSESGNHHILTGGDVIERTDNVPAGMRILYGILDKPASLIQDATVPHGKFDFESGYLEFRCARSYNHFAQEARRVAD